MIIRIAKKLAEIAQIRINKGFLSDSKSGRRQRLVGSNPTHSVKRKPSKIKGLRFFFSLNLYPKVCTFIGLYMGIKFAKVCQKFAKKLAARSLIDSWLLIVRLVMYQGGCKYS